jgi:hypothetical protein
MERRTRVETASPVHFRKILHVMRHLQVCYNMCLSCDKYMSFPSPSTFTLKFSTKFSTFSNHRLVDLSIMPSIDASPFSEGMCGIAGESLSSYAPMAEILATSCELQKSLNKCAVFYSGLEVCPELGMENSQSVLETLLCQGLRDSRLPSWSLAAHRNRVHMCGLKVEDVSPGRESEIDITLRPIRAAMYSLILPSGNGNHERDSIVTEYVRVGHDELPVHVHAISSDVIASALGSSDLLFLRQCDEQRRQRILHCFLHLPADVSILCTEAIDEEFLQLDPLVRLPDCISITEKDPVQMPFRVIGIIFRVLFAMCKSRVSSGVKAGDNLDHYIHVGAGEYEALMKQMIVLNCGFDASSLPALTPFASHGASGFTFPGNHFRCVRCRRVAGYGFLDA